METLDKEGFQGFLELIRAAFADIGGGDMDIPTMREGFNAIVSQEIPGAPPLDCHGLEVDAGGNRAEWIAPEGVDTTCAILYLHGGAYCIGSVDSHRRLIARIATAANARALALEYRLAPEHPFPAAVEDSIAAYRWMLDQGCRPETTAIAGDSAGGGLTAATLVALRDAGLPLPAAACCISPWTDLELTGENAAANAATDPMIDIAALRTMGAAYLGGAAPTTALAAPIYADLHGLPPLLIHVGRVEVLYDDSVRLAERARAAGVDVTLEAWDDMVHVWHAYADLLEQGRAAIERVGGFFNEHWKR